MNKHRHLTAFDVEGIQRVERLHSNPALNLNSPAVEVYHDFALQSAPLLEDRASIVEALAIMRIEHARMKLVIDAEERFKGVITISDLMSTKVMRVSTITGIRHDELTVKDLMTPRQKLRGIDCHDISKATVGDIIMTLKHTAEEYLLVVDQYFDVIRGLFSAQIIADRLQILDFLDNRANTFAEIFMSLRH